MRKKEHHAKLKGVNFGTRDFTNQGQSTWPLKPVGIDPAPIGSGSKIFDLSGPGL